MDHDDFRLVIEKELECVWFDFANALHHAVNGYWSIDCESKLNRIIFLTKAVGPTEWGKIPQSLLYGVYQAVLVNMDLPIPSGIYVAEPETYEVYERRWKNAIPYIRDFKFEEFD